MADIGERALIERIRARVPAPPGWVVVGIGDDAAVVEPQRGALDVVTTDALVEGVHFDRAFTSPADVGHKALAVNLSDLAAMGAAPRAAVLSLALAPETPVADVDALAEAFLACAAAHAVALVGGNVTGSPGPLVVDVTAWGAARRRKILTRAGARPGDDVYVSGAIGGAAAGLDWLRNGAPAPASPGEAQALAGGAARYRRPDPRVRLGTLLGRTRAASACIDLSDGLAAGLRQIAEASGVGLVVDADVLPIDPAARLWFARRGVDAALGALAGGEDYELLFTVPRRRASRLRAVRALARGLPLTRIGEVIAARDVLVRRGGGEEPLPESFAHFRSARPA